MKIVTFGTLTREADAIVGSFSEFNYLLRTQGWGCRRVKITYELTSTDEEMRLLEDFGHAFIAPADRAEKEEENK